MTMKDEWECAKENIEHINDAHAATSFDALSDDVIAHALSFCDARTLDTLTRTARRFRASGNNVVERGAETSVRRRERVKGGILLSVRPGESWVRALAFVEAREEAEMFGLASVSASENATTVVTRSGDVYVWGNVEDGAKKSYSSANEASGSFRPRAVHAAAGYACVIRASCDAFHVEALATSTTGVGSPGSPGNFHQSSTVQDELSRILIPPHAHAFGDVRVVQIALGRVHALACTTNGKVFSWGGDAAGQLGHGSRALGEAIARISLGRSPTVNTVRTKRRMHGGGGSPPLSLHQTFLTDPCPRQILALSDENVVKVCASRYSSMVLTKDGKVFSFGDNREGLLGVGDTIVRCSPTHVATIKEDVVDVCLGAHHALAVTDDGQVYSWGSNRRRQLGYDGEASSPWPGLVPLETQDVARCAGGGAHSICLTKNGYLYTFGANDDYQCGQKQENDESHPGRVPGIPSRIVEIAAGSKHSVAVDASGVVYGFGSNEKGQLGNFERSIVRTARLCCI